MVRSFLFMVAYYALSVVYVLTAVLFLAWPGRGPVSAIIKSYTRAIGFALRWVAGIRKETRGKERLPEGAFILAGKHQSWGDGFLVYPEVSNLAFVTGDHLERIPLLGGILRKLGAIVIDTCGGGERKAASLAGRHGARPERRTARADLSGRASCARRSHVPLQVRCLAHAESDECTCRSGGDEYRSLLAARSVSQNAWKSDDRVSRTDPAGSFQG